MSDARTDLQDQLGKIIEALDPAGGIQSARDGFAERWMASLPPRPT